MKPKLDVDMVRAAVPVGVVDLRVPSIQRARQVRVALREAAGFRADEVRQVRGDLEGLRDRQDRAVTAAARSVKSPASHSFARDFDSEIFRLVELGQIVMEWERSR